MSEIKGRIHSVESFGSADGPGVRYIVLLIGQAAGGYIQSLILASILILMGFMTFVIGLQADIIAKNRSILEDVQYHVRRLDYEAEKERFEKADK